MKFSHYHAGEISFHSHVPLIKIHKAAKALARLPQIKTLLIRREADHIVMDIFAVIRGSVCKDKSDFTVETNLWIKTVGKYVNNKSIRSLSISGQVEVIKNN